MVHRSVDQFIDSLEDHGEAEDYRSAFSGFIASHGFSLFTYAGLRLPSRGGNTRPVLSTFPVAWKERYDGEVYENVDPVLSQAAHNLTPVVWDDIVESATISKGQKQVFEEAREFGMPHGLTVPIHGQMGDFAILSVASELSDTEFRRIVEECKHDIHIASLYYHESIVNRFTKPKYEEDNIHLSRRERECLLWAARGKTAWETSEILTISENTVNFHLKNGMRKLKVYNKQHAVVRAILLYLIFP